ncbi:MAG: dicarboxylate/amino acid:cation symporter [Nitrososphaerota archaeon]|nr:dicarboxylate/amino acid:cation symporter [Nitrososphaerota archaeon]
MSSRKYALVVAIGIGFILGAIVGISFGKPAAGLRPLGDFFVRLLRMIVTPLTIVVISAAIAHMADIKRLGKVVLLMLVIFIITSFFAASIGLLAGLIFLPGEGLGLKPPPDYRPPKPATAEEVIISLIPFNFVDIFSVPGLLQAIVFSILFGIAVALMGEANRPIVRALDALSKAMIKLTLMIMWFAPIGVFGYGAWLFGTYGAAVVGAYAKLIGANYLLAIIYWLAFYSLIVKMSGRNPLDYWRVIIEPITVAFTTRSSAATLPVNLRAAERLGVPESIRNIVLPVGCTVNMDGTALYQALCALFVAQAFGISLSPALYPLIITMAMLGSVATAAIPGGGLIMLAMVLAAAGLPLEGIALIVAIDPILDALRTSINATGDTAYSTIISRIFEGPKWWEKSTS